MGLRKNVWTFEEEQLLFSSHANMGILHAIKVVNGLQSQTLSRGRTKAQSRTNFTPLFVGVIEK